MTPAPPTVVKLGGSLLADMPRRLGVVETLAAVAAGTGTPLVVVHGGGSTIDRLLARLGVQPRKCNGLRVTDATTLEAVVAVLAGTVNSSLVADLCNRGVRAVGITGVDAGTLPARRHPPVGGVDLGFVGAVATANPDLLHSLLAGGFLPVVGSLALGPGGQILNVNADAVASALAVALRARRLVLLTDVEGVADERGRCIADLTREHAQRLAASPAVRGGMKPKLDAALQAVDHGVREVHIGGPQLVLGQTGGTRLVAA